MQKKRVLFLASWFPSRENKSLGNFVQRHAEAANQVSDVSVLYAVSSEKSTDIEFERNSINGIDTLIIYYPKVKSKLPVHRQIQSKKKYLEVLKKGYHFLNKEFDLIHLNEAFPAGLFALYLKKQFGLNYVLTVHWTGYLDHTRAYKNLLFYKRILHKKIFMHASLVLPVSGHLGKSLKKLKLIKNYTVVPNVVNNHMFYPRTEIKENSINRFLHVSSFNNKHKNVVDMLKAFKGLQDEGQKFILHLITEGDAESVWKLIDDIGIETSNCIVQERSTPEEIAKAMREADCFVLFSNYETFSVVIAEAWMSGIPAIYSQCGGLTEIKNTNLGVQVDKGNLNSLTNALMNFNLTQFDRQKIVEESKDFTVDQVAKNFSEIYNKYSK